MDFTEIFLLVEHSVLGSVRAEGASCFVHEGVAEDLVKRGIAIKAEDARTDESSSE
jgi:hypothetical protein